MCWPVPATLARWSYNSRCTANVPGSERGVVWFGRPWVFDVFKQHPTAICQRFSAPLPPQWSEQVDETSSRVGWPNESAVFGGFWLMPLDVFLAGGSGMKAETEHFGILVQT